MSPSPDRMPSVKRRTLAAVAALATVGCAGAATATAATTECGASCISVFSRDLGTYAQPGFVEAVLGDGEARVGQPVGLKPASNLDPSEDILPVPGKVSDFHAVGKVSDAANREYGDLNAVQQRYAPYGMVTELCVGLASVARQNLGLTLQSCASPTTVWIVHPALSPTTPGYFPIINGSTTDFDHPFAMHLPRDEVVSGRPLQMQVRRLSFRTGEKTLPDRQLWGAVRGELR
jgi:hypothetical protein